MNAEMGDVAANSYSSAYNVPSSCRHGRHVQTSLSHVKSRYRTEILNLTRDRDSHASSSITTSLGLDALLLRFLTWFYSSHRQARSNCTIWHVKSRRQQLYPLSYSMSFSQIDYSSRYKRGEAVIQTVWRTRCTEGYYSFALPLTANIISIFVTISTSILPCGLAEVISLVTHNIPSTYFASLWESIARSLTRSIDSTAALGLRTASSSSDPVGAS